MISGLLQRARAHRVALACGAAVFVLAAIAFRVLRADAGYWTIDDAGITYAAAFQLADHHSLAMYPEGTPIEGYSNPLLFFLVALLRVFGLFDPVTTHIALEMLVFAAMVTCVWSMIRSFAGEVAGVAGALLFVVLQLATPATWIWYGSGLENVWVSAGLVALLWLCVRTARGVPLSHHWGTLAFAVAITRPEAPVYVAAAYAALATLARPDGVAWRTHTRVVLRAAIVTAALYLVFLAWRRVAYGEWLPNTYYAKMHDRHVGVNLRDYVIRGIFPYARAGVFALSVLPLLLLPKLERAGRLVLVFLVASLALPLAAGADWMGEHRFATPFLAMAHVAFVLLVAVLVARRHWAPLAIALAVVAVFVKYDKTALRHELVMNDVTVGRIGTLEGAMRWEQQMRIGVPYPVVQLPDAGGSMIVGGMQLLDNGYLTDFTMARIGRRYGDVVDLRVLDQYQHAERRPDLISIDDQFALHRTYLDTHYFMPPGGMAALASGAPAQTILAVRRDAVAPDQLDPGARIIFGNGTFQIFSSPETVLVAGRRGLVRIELIVQGQPATSDELVATTDDDTDRVPLRIYQQEPGKLERIAVLVGMPDRTGPVTVRLDHNNMGVGTFTIDVVDDIPEPVRAEILADPDPHRAARRFAWLREQRIPRLGSSAFHDLVDKLVADDRARSADVGEHLLALRHNARLAAFEDLPSPLANASRTAIARVLATCPPGDRHILCLGRAIDTLRRLGYLGVTHPDLDRANGDRYEDLVGLALARPFDLAVQRALLAKRLVLATSGPLPAL